MGKSLTRQLEADISEFKKFISCMIKEIHRIADNKDDAFALIQILRESCYNELSIFQHHISFVVDKLKMGSYYNQCLIAAGGPISNLKGYFLQELIIAENEWDSGTAKREQQQAITFNMNGNNQVAYNSTISNQIINANQNEDLFQLINELLQAIRKLNLPNNELKEHEETIELLKDHAQKPGASIGILKKIETVSDFV